METVAQLDAEDARDLLRFLKKRFFAAELRVVGDEGGLQVGEVSVPDGECERACEIVETWEEERRTAERRKAELPCPRCRSRDVGLVARDAGGYSFHCRVCGCDYDR